MPDYRLPDGRIPILLSGDDRDAVRDEAVSVGAYLAQHPEVSVDAIADMLWRTRSPRRERALILAGGHSALGDALTAIARGIERRDVITARSGDHRRIAMVVAGQGSQRHGLGAGLHQASEAYRHEIAACTQHLTPARADAVRSYLLGDAPNQADGTVVQPALVAHALGMLALWRAHAVAPDVMIGHSLGEVAAAVAAGMLDRADAMRIAVVRAEVTSAVTLDDHAMAALGISADRCAQLMARRPGWAEITVVNGPQSVCVNGDRATVADLIAQTRARGRFAKEIAITHPAHTTAMRPLADRIHAGLEAATVRAQFGPRSIECIGATLGAPIPEDISVYDYWYLNVRNTVRFDRAVSAAVGEGADLYIEIADHPVLAAGIVETLGPPDLDSADIARPVVVTTSRRSADGLDEFTRALATVVLHQQSLDRHRWAVPGSPLRLPLPGFPTTIMRRRRLWLPPVGAAVAGTGTDAAVASVPEPGPARAPTSSNGTTRLVSVWEPLVRRSIGPPRTLRVIDPSGDHSDWIALLAESAGRFGASLHVDPLAADTRADTIVWAIPRGGDPAEAVKQVTAYLTDHDVWPAGPDGADMVVIATIGAEQVESDELPSVFAAGAAIAIESLISQWPGVRCSRLDLPDSPASGADGAAAMAAIHTVGERDLAIRDGAVHVRRLRRAVLPTVHTDPGRVLIVGGTGRLGLAYAGRLVDDGARAVTLLNRTGERPEHSAALTALRARGARVEVIGCDITDPAAVATYVRDRPEPIDLLVHAAVDYIHADATALDAAALARALGAKVDGLMHLVDGSAIGPDTRVELCSSVSATFTGPGLAAYSAANRMLDAIAVHLRGRGIRCRSVQWGVFGDPTAGSDAYRALVAGAAGAGLLDLEPDDAFDAARTEATDSDALVLRADWGILARVCDLQGRPQFLPEPISTAALPPPSTAALPPPSTAALPPASRAAPSVPVETSPTETPPAVALLAVLRSVLGLDPAESIDRTMPLVGLGVDSLQALDLNRILLDTLGRDIPVTTLLSGASVDDLIDLLAGLAGQRVIGPMQTCSPPPRTERP